MFSRNSFIVKNIVMSCLGLTFLSGLMVSCGGFVESSSTTALCYDANGMPYDSSDPDAVLSHGCWQGGVLNMELSNQLSKVTTSTNSTTTTIEEKANWVYKNSSDVFVAPFVQPVCDTLRQWKAPVETTKKEFDDFSKQVTALKEMIGSPAKSSFSDTYWTILSLAAEALDYERRHPNDKYAAFTLSYGPKACDLLNFTVDNSRFGIDVNDPTP
jgi:hypothetical protein